MIIITTRSYPPELGGMQSLMGGLAIHLNQLHPIKVLAKKKTNDFFYKMQFRTNSIMAQEKNNSKIFVLLLNLFHFYFYYYL